jgi:hypothetical protein
VRGKNKSSAHCGRIAQFCSRIILSSCGRPFASCQTAVEAAALAFLLITRVRDMMDAK